MAAATHIATTTGRRFGRQKFRIATLSFDTNPGYFASSWQ